MLGSVHCVVSYYERGTTMRTITVFDDFLSKLIDSVDISNLCNSLKGRIPLDLYTQTIEGLKDEVFDLVIKSLIQEYHEMKSSSSIHGSNRSERINDFSNKIDSDDFIMHFLGKYKVLTSLIKICIKNHIEYKEDIINKYKNDKDVLGNIFKKDFGDIIGIFCKMGDQHNGRTVAKVQFTNGNLIYKPRNLNNDLLFENAVNFLKKYCTLKIEYKFPKSLSQPNYSWQEYLEYKQCGSMEEVKRFFIRAGTYLAIFYLLESFDMHYENVICQGEYPMIIDLETIARARNSSSHKVLNYHDYLSSVLNTCFIPYVNSDEGVFDINISGLFSEIQVSQKMSREILAEDEELDWVYIKSPIGIFDPKSNVMLNGKKIGPFKVQQFLLDGFENACNCIFNNKAKFCEFIEDFVSTNEIMARQILRPTQVYHRFIEASHHPDILESEEKYESISDILSKNFSPSEHGYMRVNYEISQVKIGNIPSFYTNFEDNHLYSEGKVICENYFVEPVKQSILDKVKHFSIDDIEYQKSLIKMSLVSISTEEDLCKNSVKNYDNAEHIKYDWVFSNLKRIVYNLKAIELRYDVNMSSTITIPQTVGKVLRIKPIGFDLYQGGSIIWLFAVYGKYMGDLDISSFAKRLLRQQILTYKSYEDDKTNNIGDYSVFTGAGGLLYLTYNFYKLYEDEVYFKDCEDIIEKIKSHYSISELKNNKDEDFLSGAAGLIFLLCKLYLDNPMNILYTCINELGNKFYYLLTHTELTTIGVAHGISGICMTLSILYKVIGNEQFLELLLKFTKTEEELIENNYDIQYTWCRGLTGILMSRCVILDFIPTSIQLSDHLRNWLQQFNNFTFIEKCFRMSNMSLCHGIYGNIDIVDFYQKRMKTRKYNDYLYKKYFNNLDEIKWFSNSDYSLEAFMIGSCGIAYELLKLFYELPSLLRLELFSEVCK